MKKAAAYTIAFGFLITIIFLFGFNENSPTLNQKTVKLFKSESIKLTPKQLIILKKHFSSFKALKSEVKATGGYVFYLSETEKFGNLLYIADSEESKKIGKAFDVPYQTQWASIGITTDIDSGHIIWMVCSCGSNIGATEGDNCEWDAVKKSCNGTCTGDNEGKRCGVTTIDMNTGEIVYSQTQ